MIISTFNFFYFFIPLFIWVEYYGFLNRNKVYRRLDSMDFENSSPGIYLFFLFSKLFYYIWIPLGLLTSFWIYFLVIFGLGVFKFVALLTKNNLVVNLYDFFNAFISCVLLIIILFQVLFQ